MCPQNQTTEPNKTKLVRFSFNRPSQEIDWVIL